MGERTKWFENAKFHEVKNSIVISTPQFEDREVEWKITTGKFTRLSLAEPWKGSVLDDMKYKTFWWGISLKSETLGEQNILHDLKTALLKKPAEEAYEEGAIKSLETRDGIELIFER